MSIHTATASHTCSKHTAIRLSNLPVMRIAELLFGDTHSKRLPTRRWNFTYSNDIILRCACEHLVAFTQRATYSSLLTARRKGVLNPKHQNLYHQNLNQHSALAMEKKMFPGDAVAPRWIFGLKNMNWRTTRKSTIGLDAARRDPRITTKAPRMSGAMIAE